MTSMSPRAAVIVTGTEILTGRVADANGPWLAEQLRAAGVEIARIVIVGDRSDDLREVVQELLHDRMDLVITSGGLGPTADDLTAQVVAEVAGRAMHLDPELEGRIARIVQELSRARGWATDDDASRQAIRKQALVPEGAQVLEPVGTAPGLVITPANGSAPPVLVLPGPPRELQPMFLKALQEPVIAQALRGRAELAQETLRMWGTSESQIAQTLRELAGTLEGLEITTCLRAGELEVVTRFGPEHAAAYTHLVQQIQRRHGTTLYSRDGATVDDVVAEAFRARGWSVATAESCTAGLLAGRLTDLPGSSDYVRGGLVVYSNDAKVALAGVARELITTVGAVSAQVAQALADGARERLDADIGVGITGIAGPGGGSPEKPVGLVYLCLSTPVGYRPLRVVLPGNRDAVRSRTVTLALHLIRDVLADVAKRT